MNFGIEQTHKIEFQLPEYLYLCPQGWIKFIRSNESKLSNFEKEKNQKTLDKSLSAYKATFRKTDPEKGGIVTFNSKGHYVLFLLRYGTMNKNDN